MIDPKFKIKTESSEEKYYCLLGTEDFIDDDGYARVNNSTNPNIAAKIVRNKKSRQVTDRILNNSYFIKVSPKLEVFNPIQIHSSIKDKTNNFFINNVCKNNWTFKEVDQLVFDKYIHFLNTKNVKFLKEIERDLK